ncbi:MAG: hypothetical protein EOP47_16490 [Sphingobacteriaceae bacterium]|nr:MAG: hypothetical protein EOP47_16490 [Sphingobacteriaceae bacterium]
MALTACQKDFTIDDELDPPVDPPTTAVDSNFLFKIYNIDSTASGSDTTGWYTYEYDALKRVIKITDSFPDMGTNVMYSLELLYYNGSDTLPSRSVYYDFEEVLAGSGPTQIDTFTRFFTYNAQGKLVSDSGISNRAPISGAPVQTEVYKYQYPTNKIYAQFWNRNHAGTLIEYKEDTALLNASGQVVSSKGYKFSSGSPVQYITVTISYDDKINPFSKLSSFQTLEVVPNGSTYSGEIQSANNILKSEQTGDYGNFVNDYTGKYRYNAKNYPIALVDEDPTTTGVYFKQSFLYKAL